MSERNNFIDYIRIFARSGHGGAGVRHFMRNKLTAMGGPDGGDGGRGGHIILKGNRNLWTLLHLRYFKNVLAENGENGSKDNCTGRDGKDIIIEVPLGTVARDEETGKIEAERLAQAKQLLQQLPEEQQAWGKDFVALQESIQRISEVDHIVQDNDLILGSIRVIETPGHTRGHISLYIDASKTLIANDAVVAEPDGELNIANPEFTLDLPAAVRSVQKIRDLDIEQLICFHGGIITDHIRQKLDHLIERYKN